MERLLLGWCRGRRLRAFRGDRDRHGIGAADRPLRRDDGDRHGASRSVYRGVGLGGGGILGGAFAGYTFGLGKGVFAGVEVEGDITDVVFSTNASGVSTTRSQTTVYPGVGRPMTFSSNRTSPVTTGNIETKMNYQASAVGRLGYLLTPSLMVYGLAGGTYGSFTAAGADGQTPFDLWGWTVGTGVEKKLTSALGVRLEYRYSELSGGGVTRYTATSAGTISSSATAREDFGQQTHAVRAAVSVNF